MNTKTDKQIHETLDAWGLAEVHSASKVTPPPPVAFMNAVASQARTKRIIFRSALALLALAMMTLVILAVLAAAGSGRKSIIDSDPQHMLYHMQRNMLEGPASVP